MKKIVFLLFFLSSIPLYFFQNGNSIYAQENFSKNGVYETFYENGNILTEANILMKMLKK